VRRGTAGKPQHVVRSVDMIAGIRNRARDVKFCETKPDSGDALGVGFEPFLQLSNRQNIIVIAPFVIGAGDRGLRQPAPCILQVSGKLLIL
jgi:hypothetical protein